MISVGQYRSRPSGKENITSEQQARTNGKRGTHGDEVHFFWLPELGPPCYLPEDIESNEDGDVDV